MRKTSIFIALFFTAPLCFAIPPNNTFVACDEQKLNCVAIEQGGNVEGQIPYYYSNNGGLNWNSSKIPSPGDISFYYWFLDLFVCSKDAMHCVAAGRYQLSKHGYGTYFSLVTSNRGKNWSITNIPRPDHCGGSYPSGGEFLDAIKCDESGLYCQAFGSCAYLGDINRFRNFSSSSRDGGINWSKGVFI